MLLPQALYPLALIAVDHAVGVQQVIGLLLVQQDLGSVFQDRAGDLQVLVGGAFIGHVAVAGVRVGRQGREQGGQVINLVAHRSHGPQGCRMGRGGPQGLLGGPHVGVDLRAVLLRVRGNVQIGHAVEIPVDPLGLGLQGRRHGGVVAPSGGQQDPGRHAETGIDLSHQFQAGFLPGHGVHAAHNVRRRHAVRFQTGAGHVQGFRLPAASDRMVIVTVPSSAWVAT